MTDTVQQNCLTFAGARRRAIVYGSVHQIMPHDPSPVQHQLPAGDTITDYDRAHISHYMRLLDAEAAGVAWQEAAQIILGLDPVADTSHAYKVYTSHLARAQWLATSGYKHLLKSDN